MGLGSDFGNMGFDDLDSSDSFGSFDDYSEEDSSDTDFGSLDGFGKSDNADDLSQDFSGAFDNNNTELNNQFTEDDDSGNTTRKSAITAIVVGIVGVVLVFTIASKFNNKSDKSTATSTKQTYQQQTQQQSDGRDAQNVDNVMGNKDNTDGSNKTTVVTKNMVDENKFSWVEIDDKQQVDFLEDYQEMTFTVTSINYYARSVDSNNNLVVKATLTGSISGLSGTYVLDVPYNKGIKLVVGDSFTVHVQFGTYNGKTVVGEINY